MSDLSQGEYTAVVELPEGKHEYKFVVDGQWYHKQDEVRLSTFALCGLTTEAHSVQPGLAADNIILLHVHLPLSLPPLVYYYSKPIYLSVYLSISLSFFLSPSTACNTQQVRDLQQCGRLGKEACRRLLRDVGPSDR